ncbi:hypothetical protein ABKN59_009488 [Abortiporus biennis]
MIIRRVGGYDVGDGYCSMNGCVIDAMCAMCVGCVLRVWCEERGGHAGWSSEGWVTRGKGVNAMMQVKGKKSWTSQEKHVQGIFSKGETRYASNTMRRMISQMECSRLQSPICNIGKESQNKHTAANGSKSTS